MSAVWLVRHGQASFAAADYDVLSPLGELQARMLGEALTRRRLRPDLVVCGGMRRHRQTAQACLQAMELPVGWDEDAGWNEYDHNDVLAACDPRHRSQTSLAADLDGDGDPRAAFQRVFAAAMTRWISGAHDDDYAESWNAFHARVGAALAQLTRRLGSGRTALVFTSGGAIASACRQVLALDDVQTLRLNWALANASMTRLLVGRTGTSLSTFNEHAHLEETDGGAAEKRVTYF